MLDRALPGEEPLRIMALRQGGAFRNVTTVIQSTPARVELDNLTLEDRRIKGPLRLHTRSRDGAQAVSANYTIDIDARHTYGVGRYRGVYGGQETAGMATAEWREPHAEEGEDP